MLQAVLTMHSGSVKGQQPLLLKQGSRIAENNLEQWVAGFSLQAENCFDGRFYKILQFSQIPSDAQKTILRQQGVELLSYLPVNGYFAAICDTFKPASLLNQNIWCVTSLTHEERLAPALLLKEIPAWSVRSGNRIEVVVTLFSDVKLPMASASLAQMGWEVVRESASGMLVYLVLPVGELYTLAGLPFVQFIEPCDPPSEPENSRGRSLHRATSAFNPASGLNDYDGTNVRVMLNDDGYVGDHIDFTGRIPFQYTQVTGADHGDHCAGTILGAGNLNPLGMGMAPGADLVVYSATNYPGFDSIYTQYQSLGIRLTSTSYSDGCNAGYTNRAAMLDEQIRTMPELMHVFSAGNNGTQNCSYGAGSGWGNITGGHKMAKNAIAVANVSYKDELAGSSSRGPAHDGRIKPDVSALGTSVFSTSESNTYATKSGTSMACPGVTGTLATLYDAYQRHNGGTPHGALMKGILMNSADDLGNPGPDFRFGYGRVNARRGAVIIEDTLWKTDLISNGDSVIYNLTIPAGTAEVRFMMNWSDYEAVVNSTKTLVNNLDLVVTGPDSTWLPWVLNHLPNATTLNANATRKTDTLNNAEQVTLLNPTSGNYQIKIYGTAVPMGPQRFFLNWITAGNEFLVTWPQQGSSLVPGETEVIRWDALPSSQTFALDYTVNGGVTWDTVATSIAAGDRAFDWVVPAFATGIVQLKLTRGSQNFTTSPFTVIEVPQNIVVNWVCIDSMSLSWSSVPGATGYDVYRLGSQYMDSLAYTGSNSIILHGIPQNTTEWFSVRAKGPNNAKGRRSLAKERSPGLLNCIYAYDAALQQIITPNPTMLSTCQSIPPLTVRCLIKNNGSTSISNVPVGYRVNQGFPVQETFSGTIAPGGTATYQFNTTLNISAAGDYTLKVWTKLTTDQYIFNDTVVHQLKIASFPVLQIPFTETFETFTICPTANGCEQNLCSLSAGWYNTDNGLFDQTDWIAHSGTTPSFNTGPSGDHTTGTTSGKFLYVEASNCSQRISDLMTPCIDLTTATLPVLSFWYHMYGTSMGSLMLDVLVDGVWQENYIPVIQGNQGNAWKNKLVPLNDFAGKVINLRFRGTIGLDFTSDICLDDVSVLETVGMETSEAAAMLTLAPNPASDNLLVSGISQLTATFGVVIFTQQGQQVLKQTFMVNAGAFQQTIPLSDLAPGMYLVRIDSNDLTITKKLVITR